MEFPEPTYSSKIEKLDCWKTRESKSEILSFDDDIDLMILRSHAGETSLKIGSRIEGFVKVSFIT